MKRILAALLLSACAVDASETSTDTGSSISATIGAAGGTIEGAAGTPLAGVKLVVPAGALAGDTELTLHPTYDATPLPALAVRVGMQVAIEPAVSLAVPATLTLPTEPVVVAANNDVAADCLVWGRADDGWQMTAPTTTADGSVTIDIGATSTYAAGVRRAPAVPACGSGEECLPCSDAGNTGFCTQLIPFAGPSAETIDFAVTADSLYYVTLASGADGPVMNAVRVRLSDGGVTQSTTVALSRGLLFGQPVVDTDGSLWVGLAGEGNVQLRFGAPSVRYDFSSPLDGVGTTLLRDGTLVRATNLGWTARVGGSFGPVHPWTHEVYRIAADADIDAMWVLGFAPAQPAEVTQQSLTGATTSPGVANEMSFTGAPIAVSTAVKPYHDLVAGSATASGQFGLGILRTGAPASFVGMPFEPYGVSFGTDGRLWVADGHSPEVAVYDPVSGALSATSLVGTTGGLTDPDALVPRAIHALPTGGALVMTARGQFILVK